MAQKFRTMGQKKSKAIADPPAVSDPLIIQDPQLAPGPVLALTAPSEVEPSLSKETLLDKHKGNHLVGGPSKSIRKRRGK